MRLRKLAALAATAAVAVTGVSTATASAWSGSIDTGTQYRIETFGSLALDVQGGAQYDGAPVIQWPYNGGANQKWRFLPTATPLQYKIQNVNSGKCLTSLGGRYGLVQFTCSLKTVNQEWVPVFGTYPDRTQVRFHSATGNGSLDVPGGTGSWGVQLLVWPYSGALNQQFHLTPM